MIDCDVSVESRHSQYLDVLQMPDSRPTAKQLESSLKETDKTAAGVDVSIGGLTFILAVVRCVGGPLEDGY